MKLKYRLSNAFGAMAFPIIPARFSNAPDAPSRALESSTASMPTIPSRMPAA